MKISKAINSSAIRAAEFDTLEKLLVIKFTNGRTYEYRNVPFKVFDDLLKAESAGKYYNAIIRGKFE